jgi:hypothetical protein
MPWIHLREWTYIITLLDFGISWKWVVSFMLLFLYPRGKNTRYSFDSSLCGIHSPSGRCGEEKNLTPFGNRTPAVQPEAHRYTDWAIPALKPRMLPERGDGKSSKQRLFLLVSCLAYSSTLKMQAIRLLETLMNFYQTIWRYISEDSTHHN